MNKIYKYIPILALVTTTFIAEPVFAQNSPNNEFRPFLTRSKTTWSVGGGVRVNNFDWNIASDRTGTATPNILSELTWRDITLFEITGEVRHEIPADNVLTKGDLHFELNLSAGLPISGENQDSDYNGDNRTDEFSRTIADADGGYSVGASAAIGYKFYLTGDPATRARDIMATKRPVTTRGRARRARAISKIMNKAKPAITLMPLVGFSVSQQKYTMTSVDQIIPALGPAAVDDFDWHYESNWYGAFAGLEAEIKGQKNMLRLRGEYHDLEYYGEGFWRGRAGFRQDPSFTHAASGSGILLNAEYGYALGEDYALTIDATYESKEAEDGIYKVFFVNNATSAIRLNEVNDESYGIHAGVRYNW